MDRTHLLTLLNSAQGHIQNALDDFQDPRDELRAARRAHLRGGVDPAPPARGRGAG